MQLCGNIGCCYTPWLQGNFDEGNSDFFSGQSQLGECFDFAFMDQDYSFNMGELHKFLQIEGLNLEIF